MYLGAERPSHAVCISLAPALVFGNEVSSSFRSGCAAPHWAAAGAAACNQDINFSGSCATPLYIAPGISPSTFSPRSFLQPRKEREGNNAAISRALMIMRLERLLASCDYDIHYALQQKLELL